MNTQASLKSPVSCVVLTVWLVLAALVPGRAGATGEVAGAAPSPAVPSTAAPTTAAQAPAAQAPAAQAPATQAPAAPATPAAPQVAPESAPAPAGGAADLNFDLLDEGKKAEAGPTVEELRRRQLIEQKTKLRRPMLQVHQALGFVTLAALAATVIIGHLNYYDKYESGDFSGRYEKAHLGLGIGTSVLFGTTGLLAVFAPNPYPKPLRFDTAMVHKLSMILATAGMVTQVVLGPITSNRVGRQDQANLALAHVVTGYATWAFMAAGTIAYFF